MKVSLHESPARPTKISTLKAICSLNARASICFIESLNLFQKMKGLC